MSAKTLNILRLFLFTFVSTLCCLLVAQTSDPTKEPITEASEIKKEKKSENEEGKKWKDVQVTKTEQNIEVPTELWDHINLILRNSLGKKSLDDYAILPISLQVELVTEDPYVFKTTHNFRLMFAEGGGTVDFFDYIAGKGEFHVRLSPHLVNDNPFYLLYVSDSPGKVVEGDEWGNGCGRIYNLSHNARYFIYDQGIKVTSARRHHLHLLAGTYVFFQLVEERLFLGYIHLTDSRFPQFNCRQI